MCSLLATFALLGMFMIIGVTKHITSVFFMESLLLQLKKSNTIKKSMCVKVLYL